MNKLIGRSIKQNNGHTATAIKYLTRDRIRVRFENGVERECDRKNFVRGRVRCRDDVGVVVPALKVGTKYQKIDGTIVKVVKILSDSVCVVRYQNGTERNCLIKHIQGRELSEVYACDEFTQDSVGAVLTNMLGMRARIICIYRHCKIKYCRCVYEDGIVFDAELKRVRKGNFLYREDTSWYGNTYKLGGIPVKSVRYNYETHQYEKAN